MVDDLKDLFGATRTHDDSSLSTEGVEELFVKAPDELLEVEGVDALFAPRQSDDEGLTLPPVAPAAATPAEQPESIHDLLAALADDLKKLADDIHALLED